MPDVKMPDGTIIRNVPEGTTRAQLMARVEKAQPQQRGVLRRADDFVRGVADAVTFGYSDEIAAGLGSLTGLGGQKGNYQANVAAQRQRDMQGGGERIAGQVAGAVALPVSRLSAAKGLKGVAASAAEGAGYGAAYATGSAEGGVRERARAAPAGAALGAAGGLAGRAVGAAGARALRGRQVPKPVRELADADVIMTPGKRGGQVRRLVGEGITGSIPGVREIPKAAQRRSVGTFNVAWINKALEPIGIKYPTSRTPGHELIQEAGDKLYSVYDDSISGLGLARDSAIQGAANSIIKDAKASVGQNAGQLKSIVTNTLGQLDNGPIVGPAVRDLLKDLRGQASGFMRSTSANEQNIGKELWRLHDHLDAALLRQNRGGDVELFKSAREAVSRFKRVEGAAARGKGGVFSPGMARSEATRRGFGMSTQKAARGTDPMHKLADAAAQVLPDVLPSSGSAERIAGLGLLTAGGTAGPAIAQFLDPTFGALTTAPLVGYVPGIDRILQNLALNRPDLLTRAGNAVERAGPALGTAGAMTAISQGR